MIHLDAKPVAPVSLSIPVDGVSTGILRQSLVRFATVLLASVLLMIPTGPLLAGEVVSWSGETMGTRYVVKIYHEADHDTETIAELRSDVDLELRHVNDQMSTYLKSSELSRFNDSSSTDWVATSQPLVQVIAFAIHVSKATDGAFDVTVGPLVDAWNFGPPPRTGKLPSPKEIEKLQQRIGYKNLEVRWEPPSLKKAIPELRVDLSAIAKGHGVDRIVELLDRQGYLDVFVEIGGEVRTAGSKGGAPWVVGIQSPDQVMNHHDLAYPFLPSSDKCSMATSGDYRNYIEIDGKRYSHTIDPRTGRPIEHRLASVSIVRKSCMEADAWATAINVLGPEEGRSTAEAYGLDVLMMVRTRDGFERTATGEFSSQLPDRASQSEPPQKLPSSAIGSPTTKSQASKSQGIAIAIITFIAFLAVLLAMAIGVIVQGKSISGSCGGLNGVTNEDGTTRCSLCSNPADACKELREKMKS